MALSYLPVDRDQQFLLPPDIRDWLPEGHLAWLVIDVVERLDTALLHACHPNDGVGRRAYDPDMLLALLIYGYCCGVRSSRRLEALCESDVAYRLIAANHRPDHSTIARFRQGHEAAAVKLFVDVLSICAAAGLAKVGVVAVDGTKVAANASMKANRTRAQIEVEVAEMFAEAQRVDEAEDRLFGDGRGDELPEDLIDPRSRRVRLDAALSVLEAQESARGAEERAARAARQQAAAEAMASGRGQMGRPALNEELARAEAALELARARAKRHREQVEARAAAEGRKPPGGPAGKGRRVARAEARVERARARAAERAEQSERQAAQAQANTTDPDSRLMKTKNGWVQGYNAQAAVSEDQLFVAAEVTPDQNDVAQAAPMIKATEENLAAAGVGRPVGTMLFDAGYFSEQNLTAPGPDRLIATTKSWKLRRQAKQHGFATGEPPKDASPTQAMEHRLRTQEGYRLYAKRQHTVEPVFGQTKHNLGFIRFMRRGLTAVDAEWKLTATAHNLLKLHRHGGLGRLATT